LGFSSTASAARAEADALESGQRAEHAYQDGGSPYNGAILEGDITTHAEPDQVTVIYRMDSGQSKKMLKVDGLWVAVHNHLWPRLRSMSDIDNFVQRGEAMSLTMLNVPLEYWHICCMICVSKARRHEDG